ncbi:MAG: tetratricopeptide repeat protein [Candidatus Eisenbacteria bacterium]
MSPEASQPRAWRLFAVLFAAFLPYLPALRCGFVFDDHGLLEAGPAVKAPGPGPAWTLPYWPGQPEAGLFRPWTTMSYWLDHRLFGLSPPAFHATNVALHLAVTLLAYLLLLRLFPRREGATLATALLFAVHPLHTEAVTQIVGRAELWAALGAVGAYLALLHAVDSAGRARAAWSALSTLAFFVGLFSKESAIGMLALPLVHALFAGRDRFPAGGPEAPGRARSFLLLGSLWLLPVVALFAARLRVLGHLFGLSNVSEMDNLLMHVAPGTRTLAALGYQWLLLERLLFPLRLSADYSFRQLTPTVAWQLAGVAFLVGALVFATVVWRRKDAPLTFGVIFLLAAGLLTSNILIPIGTIMGERLAYLPSLGSIWIAVELAQRIASWRWRASGEHWSRAGLIALLTILVALGARTAVRCGDWKDDLSLFSATARTSPRSGKAHSNLAITLIRLERYDEALAAARTALTVAPGYRPAEGALGSVLFRLNRGEEAIPHLKLAATAPPIGARNIEAALELGNACVSVRRGAEAESAFALAERVSSKDDVRWRIGRASALAVQERWPESARAWHNAAALSPNDPAVRRQWAYALWQAGAADSAETIYLDLTRAAPKDADVLNDAAWFLAQNRRRGGEAVHLARRAFRARPDENAADTVVSALWSARGVVAAQAWVDSLRGAGADAALLASLEAKLKSQP